MAESQRKQTSGRPALEGSEYSLHDKLTLVAFLFGAVGIVAGMFWLANGLSVDFDVQNGTFYTFVIGIVAMMTIFMINKYVVKQ